MSRSPELGPSPEEEVGRDTPFNPEKEISDADWDQINKRLSENRIKGHEEAFLSQASAMRLVDPERKIDMGDFSWHAISGTQLLEVSITASEKILFPDKDPVSDPKIWKEVKSHIEKNREFAKEEGGRYGYGGVLANEIMDAKIVFPDKKIELDEEDTDLMVKRLQDCREKNKWGNFISLASAMKVVLPKMEILKAGDWEGMRKELQRCKENIWHAYKNGNLAESNLQNWEGFIDNAARMKIIAAEEVKVTDRGLEIRMAGEKEK